MNGAYAYIISEYEKGNDITGAYEKTTAYNSLHSLRYYLGIMQNAMANNRIGEMTKQHCKSEYNLSFEKLSLLERKHIQDTQGNWQECMHKHWQIYVIKI